jgi:hypothetical protein
MVFKEWWAHTTDSSSNHPTFIGCFFFKGDNVLKIAKRTLSLLTTYGKAGATNPIKV